MDPITQQQALATAGAAGAGEGLYVDDVFSTYLYEGTSSAQTITNGIDLSGEGGMAWIKKRDGANSNLLYDTERGVNAYITSNAVNAEYTASSQQLTAFNNNGFTLGNESYINGSGNTFASWTFRKAPGFFDVVTYTGTGSAQSIAHSLGSVPGMVIVKCTSATGHWVVNHVSTGAGTGRLFLNLTNESSTASAGPYWNSTAPTSTHFTVGADSNVNANGETFVAYIFGNDDQSFGTNGDESIVKCGSYTGNGSTDGPEINLGWEPQYVLIKRSSSSSNWYLYDIMRGMVAGSGDNALFPNLSNVETVADFINPTATGFKITATSANINANGSTYVYMAIRRPHKPPTAGTDVFAAQATRGATDGTPSALGFTAGFPVDLLIAPFRIGGTGSHAVLDRVRGGKNTYLATASTAAESNTNHRFDSNEGVFLDSTLSATSNYGGLMFKRAPGFFDIVAYEGTGSARTINHNLGAVPKMMIVKKRDTTESWSVYTEAYGNAKTLWLNDNSGGVTSTQRWNSTTPTDSVFSVGTDTGTNGSGGDYIAYLFGDVSGISKVGSYTGTGNNIDVDCGFTNGARFVLIKRYGGIGEWHLWDSARGIIAGNDPYVELNTAAAEKTNLDYLDPLNSGFTVTSTANNDLNENGGTYVFLAIA